MKLTFTERQQIAEIRARARKREPKKPRSPKGDRGRERDNAYLAWLRRQRCCLHPVGCGGPTEAAHIRFAKPGEPMTGMQRKPDDRRALPLCGAHHRWGKGAQHHGSERQFWADRGIDPHALADDYYARFQGGNDG